MGAQYSVLHFLYKTLRGLKRPIKLAYLTVGLSFRTATIRQFCGFRLFYIDCAILIGTGYGFSLLRSLHCARLFL